MPSPDPRGFQGPAVLSLGAAAVSILLFAIWAKQKTLPHRDVGALVGAVFCLTSMIALLEVVRRAVAPSNVLVSAGLYLVGGVVSLVATFTYALVFQFLWTKDF